MIEKESVVRTADGGEWGYTSVLPESIDEAREVYDDNGAYNLLISGLTVKQQNVAREMFRKGKTREEVDAAVAAYRPGIGGRTSVKAQALKLIMDKNNVLQENPDLLTRVQEAFVSGNFKEVVEILG